MAPRVTLLIIVSIVLYVSLSLYHWRQEKKLPHPDKQAGVHTVLTRDRQEKNWVQVSTSPAISGASAINSAPTTTPLVKTAQAEEQEKLPPTDSHTETTLPAENEPAPPAQQGQKEQQIVHAANSEPFKTPQDEEGNQQPESLTAKPGGTVPAEDNQITILKTALTARLEALAKANDRITALADRLEQGKRTLAETENTNSQLQRVLSETEIARITARQRADSLNAELIRTREDKEKYLAETGRLQKQLQQTRTRLARIENVLNGSHLKAEAMLRYGQEQSEFVTPFLQQIKVLNAKVEDKNGELIKAQEQIELLQDQDQLLQNTIQTLKLDQQKNANISQKLQEKSQALDKEQKHTDELTLQLKALAGQLNAKDILISTLNQDLVLARTSAQNTAQQAEILGREADQQQQELAAARQTLAEMQQQLDLVSARQKETETRLNDAKTENQQLTAKVKDQLQLQAAEKTRSEENLRQLNEKNKQLAEANKSLHTTRTALQELETAEKSRTKTKSTATSETITQLKDALNTAQSRLTETDAEINKLKESLAETENKQADNTATIKLQQENDLLQKTVAGRDKQQQTLELTLAALKQENKQLQEQFKLVEQEKRNTSELASALEQKTIELDEEKARLALLENKTADLQSELDRREDTFFTLQEEYTSLQDRHDSLQKERDALLLYTRDSDNDTVSDAQDACPDTVSGAEVGEDGCERDQDNDTIVDRLDLCPDIAEQNEINSFGCARGAAIVLSGIYFSGGNTELSPASRSYLDKVAAVLDTFGDIRFEVAGHTDNIGETERNLTVSKKRAEAVSNYLVEKGIEADRLVPVGYGHDQPVADNTTSEGRAANRRVELRIIPTASPSAAIEQEESTAIAQEEGLPGQ